MRVLIAGCGYVGTALGAELARQGHDVFGLRRSGADADGLKAAGIRPLKGDITRPSDLAGLPGPFEWVVNCVASGGGGEADYRRVYLEGTRNLLEWLAAAPPRKFIYTSSTSVYGQTDGSRVDETSAATPAAPTARILVETEKMLLAARQNHFPAVILRVAGIYGPGRGHGFQQFLKSTARLEGEGRRFLNMIHRDDLVGAVLAALEKGRPGEIYNVVDDEPVSQRHFFEWLAAALGRELPPAMAEDPDARKRGVTHKQVANRKLKLELGYTLKYPTFRKGYGAELRGVHESATQPPIKPERC